MNFFSDDRAAELRDIFFESAGEVLQAMNEAGLSLEENPGDMESFHRVRRAVHTLKGDSAACGFRELSELAHELEDVLTPELALSSSAEIAEVVLHAADAFDEMLTAYQKNLPPPDGAVLRAHVHSMLSVSVPVKAAAPQSVDLPWTEYERLLIGGAMQRGESVHRVLIRLSADNQMAGPALALIRKSLATPGTILAIRPAEGAALNQLQQVEAFISTTSPKESIEAKCRIPGIVSEVIAEPVRSEDWENQTALLGLLEESKPPSAPLPAPYSYGPDPDLEDLDDDEPSPLPATLISPAPPENTLRVDAARIDIVMNLVGELIIGKSMLHRTVDEFERQHFKDPLRGKFADALAFQSRVLGELQKSVMKIRMVPVEQLFRRFPRLVRDVAKSTKKEIVLDIQGQHTDLDKTILDAVAEPLAHLVRNAAGHGIEPAETRVAAGKPAHGTVRLNAYHQGTQVVISVSDDGAGLDRDKIILRAIESGLISEADADRLNDTEAFALIFKPGLTTADEVTELAGRGVGMDVVQNVIEKLKGSITLSSERGKGTQFLLMLPLTLASIQALMFRACGRLYAVPLASVVEITRATAADIHRVDDREVLRLRDQILTLVRLERLSTLPAESQKTNYVIVVSSGTRRFGIIVDRLLGEEELVIKALEDRLVASEFVSGASILGDGTVVLILNVVALIARLSKHQPLGATA
ncbi:MAG: chemotaxis protein CheA [Candidatus Acidiferrales bacterium]